MLSVKTKIGYGIGDLANNLMFQLSVLYLLFFYTDIAGIQPVVVGGIFLAARIWDAVNDPMMGIVIDHTKSKYGKSRVYLRCASLPLALATIFLFRVPELSGTGKTAYAAITYILWGMLYTMISIPYASMTAELTGDPEERTSLSSVRMIFMLFGVIIVSVATEPLTGLFGDPARGYFYAAVIYAVFAFFLFQICFYATGRRGKSGAGALDRSASKYSLRETFVIVSKNKPLLVLTVAFLLGATAEYAREASVIYFVNYNMGNGSLLPLFMGVVVISMIAANLLIPAATRKFDKRGTYTLGTIIGIIGSFIFHFVPHDSLPAVLSMAALSSFGFTVVSTLGWAMLPDTVEYGEAATGVRTEGVIYSFFSFSQKLATAFAGAVVALTLQLTGYVANNPVQAPSALTGILSTLTFIPIVFIGLSAVILRFYNLDRRKFSEIRNTLEERRAENNSVI